MKKLFLLIAMVAFTISGEAQNHDFQIKTVKVDYQDELDQYVFKITVEGSAGKTTPIAVGQLDGAPVDGYVFLISLKPENVGFGSVDGIVSLALTSHPDFDNTPLWDKNKDAIYDIDDRAR